MLGTREPAKLAVWKPKKPTGSIGSFSDAAKFGEIIVLAVKGLYTADALRAASAANLSGKIVIDTTNPIAAEAPVNGVLKYFTGPNESLMERLQAEFKDTRFVKAFSSVGNPSMVNPNYKEGRPTMFICGNDDAAKKMVTGILDQFGWETADMGKVETARAIEPLAMLWCIPGLTRNQWTHAFKLLT